MRLLHWILIPLVPAVSFIVTLTALDHWWPASRAAVNGGSDIKATPIYRIDIQSPNPNYRPATARTTADRSGGVLGVASTSPMNEYLLTTDVFPTTADVTYKVRLSSTHFSGRLSVGALDERTNSWIVTSPVRAGDHQMEFRARSDRTRLIIFNGGDAPVKATLSDLSVFKQ